MRLSSKHSSRPSLAPGPLQEGGYSSSSGFSSLPPSQISPSTSPSSPSSSSASPPDSSSSQPDSDSNSSLEEREEQGRKPRARQGKKTGGKECQGCLLEGEKVKGITLEVDRLGQELASTRQTILRMHEREEKMKVLPLLLQPSSSYFSL